MLRIQSEKLLSVCFFVRKLILARPRLLTAYQVPRDLPGDITPFKDATHCQASTMQIPRWTISQAPDTHMKVKDHCQANTLKISRQMISQATDTHTKVKHCQASTLQISRQMISQATNTHQPTGKVTEFKPIYRLPYIWHVRLLSRLKLAQTIFVVGIVPPLGIARQMDLLTDAQVLFPVCVATFALVMMYCMSFYLRRIIGIMYINQNGSKLKVAHLNFWGQRRDFVVDVEDVLSSLETGDSKDVLLRKFETFDSKNYFYFTLKYGQILDKKIFYEIFGKP